MDKGDYLFGFFIVSLTIVCTFLYFDKVERELKTIEVREVLLADVINVDEVYYSTEHKLYFAESGLFKAEFNKENTEVISHEKVWQPVEGESATDEVMP